MKSRLRRNYEPDEVRALVEDYAEWTYYRDSSFILVRLMDIDQVMKRLRPKILQAVFLQGHMGYTAEASGKLVGVSTEAMHKRYVRGIEQLVSYLNGGA